MADTSETIRVACDDLEFDDQLALLDGEPFTGTAFSLYPDGRLESESRYVAGLPEGLQEEWYPNGRLFRRNIAVRGRGSSEAWTWYGNGVMRTYSRHVDLRPVEARAWSEAGHPVDPSSLRPVNDTTELRRLFEGARNAPGALPPEAG